MKILKTKKFAQTNPSPLDGKSKQQAKSIVNKIISTVKLNGIFSDNNWKPIHELFAALSQANLDWQTLSSEYYKDMNDPTNQMPVGKKWAIEINHINNRNIPSKLHCHITASGAGTVQDPLSKYDVIVNVD
jgi:hypothetical protein